MKRKRDLLKIIIGIQLFFCVGQILNGQDVKTWIKTFGDDGWDYGTGIHQTSDGGYLIAGNSDNCMNFFLKKLDENGVLILTKIYGMSSYFPISSMEPTENGGYILSACTSIFDKTDICIVRIDSEGDTIWTKVYSRPGDDAAGHVEQTSDGGYIISGQVDFNHWDDADGILIKTDENGDTIWTKIDTSAFGYDIARQIADGGYILAANYMIEESDGSRHTSIRMLIRTDFSGDTIWTKYFENCEIGWGSTICQTIDGGYILIGNTVQVEGEEKMDLWIQKVDDQGDSIWSRTYVNDESTWGRSIQQTNDGGYVALANRGSYYDVGGGDIWILKTDSYGDTLWTKSFGGIEHYSGDEVKQTSDGGYIILGRIQPKNGTTDLLLIKTDALGNVYTTSVNKFETGNYINIFPNPTANLITIETGQSGHLCVEITSSNGKLILSKEMKGTTHQIDLSSFTKGMYFITIQSDEIVTTRKIIKL